MGDISEMRGLIVLFAIISITITLILLIPPGFYSASIDPATSPDATPGDLVAWNSTYAMNLTYNALTFTEQDAVINGYNFGVFVFPSEPGLIIDTYAEWGPFVWDIDYFHWYISGTDVSDSVSYGFWDAAPGIFTSTIDSYDTPAKFTLKNTKTQATVTCAYNTSAYASFESALIANNGNATLVFNVDWNDRSTSMNALQLVGMVLTGSLPNVHPYLSVAFGFIAWGLVAAGVYLAFIFVLRIVGAVFGGGGA